MGDDARERGCRPGPAARARVRPATASAPEFVVACGPRRRKPSATRRPRQRGAPDDEGHPVDRNDNPRPLTTRQPNATRSILPKSDAGRPGTGPPRLADLRRAGRPPGDRRRAGRGRHHPRRSRSRSTRCRSRLRGTDLIGQAPTGTGKTLGFGVPLLDRVLAPAEGADGSPQALVVVPTRELGLQVARDIAGRRQDPRRARAAGLRRRGLRAAGRGAQARRRDHRRHARPAARPVPAGQGQAAAVPAAGPGPRARARRGRPDARPGLPRRRREDPGDAARGAADHALLGHHAGPDRDAGPALPAPAGDHPRPPRRRRPARRR